MSVRVARLPRLSLAFDNSSTEEQYVAYRSSNAVSADRFKLASLGVVSVINLSIAAYMTVNSTPLWLRLLRALGPHSLVYGCHLAVSHCSWYKRWRTPCVLLFEALYISIAVPGVPKFVASPPTSMRAYVKTVVIGSGAFMGVWYSAFSDKPWCWDLVAIPLEHLAFVHYMIPPTCKSLTSNDFGRQTTLQLLEGLRSSRGEVQQLLVPKPDVLSFACSVMLYVWLALWCAITLYGRYRLELKRRMAFSPMATSGWVMTPSIMHVVLHFAVACVGMSWLVF